MTFKPSEQTRATANSAAANEARRARQPITVDWDDAIARLRNLLDDLYGTRP